MNGRNANADDERVVLAAQGDGAALGELLEAYGPRVRASLSIGRQRARDLDADDVMQVTYLEAYLRIRGLHTQTPAGFQSWLRRIAENNLRDAVRGLERDKRQGADRRITQGAASETSRTLLQQLAGSSTTASRRASIDEACELVRSAVARLPRSYREVVQGYDLDERSVHDLAQERGCSKGAVYMLRSRAHDRLRELLGSADDFFSDSA